jgi:hypothetical protein
MATKGIATGIGKNNEKIELSDAQSNPRLAEPTDFEILQNGGDGGKTLPFHGQCGDSRAEYQKLIRPNRDKGKSPRITPSDAWGRKLVSQCRQT